MNATLRFAWAGVLAAGIALPPIGRAMEPPASAATAPLPVAVQQLQHDVRAQQQHSRKLRGRVDALERQQAQDRDDLQQRDRTIEALRRQLEQLTPASASSAAAG